MSVDNTESPAAQKWRRRERAMGIGVVLWALGLTGLLTYAPELAIEWLTGHEPPLVTGSILISIGLLGAVGQTILEAAHYHVTAHYDSELTEVPWNE